MSGFIKAIHDCFSIAVNIIDSNLLDSYLETSEPEEPAKEKEKKRGTPNIESFTSEKGKAADYKTGKASNEDHKAAVLDSIKQDLKANELGDSIDSERPLSPVC